LAYNGQRQRAMNFVDLDEIKLFLVLIQHSFAGD